MDTNAAMAPHTGTRYLDELTMGDLVIRIDHVVTALPDGGTGLFLVDPSGDGVTRDGYTTHDGGRAARIALDGATGVFNAVDASVVRYTGGPRSRETDRLLFSRPDAPMRWRWQRVRHVGRVGSLFDDRRRSGASRHQQQQQVRGVIDWMMAAPPPSVSSDVEMDEDDITEDADL